MAKAPEQHSSCQPCKCGNGCWAEEHEDEPCWGEVSPILDLGAELGYVHACSGHVDAYWGDPYEPPPKDGEVKGCSRVKPTVVVRRCFVPGHGYNVLIEGDGLPPIAVEQATETHQDICRLAHRVANILGLPIGLAETHDGPVELIELAVVLEVALGKDQKEG